MYHVIIADDEKLVCEGIVQSVDWKSMGMEVAGIAFNGAEALSLCDKADPQIVITDIRMPKMDGIELIRALRKLNRNIRIIVVSGYDDSQYLKEAINNGVESYLLKPIDEDEFKSVLKSVVDDLNKNNTTQLLLREGIPLIYATTIRRLLEGNIGKREFKEKASFLDLDFGKAPYRTCLIHIDRNKDSSADDCEMGIASFAVNNIISELLKENDMGISLEYDATEVVLITHNIDCERIGKLESLLYFMKHFACNEFGYKIHYAIGETVNEIEEFSKSFSAARKGLKIEIAEENTPRSIAVQKTLDYIRKNFREIITLKEMSEELYINASYLGQLFKKEYGCSFNNCLNKYRIEYACRLLENTNYRMYEVGNMSGFSDQRYFIKTFKKYTGKKPSEFRKNV